MFPLFLLLFLPHDCCTSALQLPYCNACINRKYLPLANGAKFDGYVFLDGDRLAIDVRGLYLHWRTALAATPNKLVGPLMGCTSEIVPSVPIVERK